jgi:hypothetical protein
MSEPPFWLSLSACEFEIDTTSSGNGATTLADIGSPLGEDGPPSPFRDGRVVR